MTIENDFLPYAVASGANVQAQADYAASSILAQGAQSGVAVSAVANKAWRQSSIIASVIAQFVVAQTSQPALDDGTTATLLANFEAAIQNLISATAYARLTDLGLSAQQFINSGAVGTTIAPSWAGQLYVRAWGYGAPGGNGTSAYSGGGGGAGGYVEGVIETGIVGGMVLSYSAPGVGSGLPTVLQDAAGRPLITCYPGQAGGNATGTTLGLGGLGGSGNGPTGSAVGTYAFRGFTLNGGAGTNGIELNSTPGYVTYIGGAGGAAFCGSPTQAFVGNGSNSGEPGCGGGGGAQGGTTGGPGSGGLIIYQWFPAA